MNGWDAYLAHPALLKQPARDKLADMIRTAQALARVGVPYPHASPDSPP